LFLNYVFFIVVVFHFVFVGNIKVYKIMFKVNDFKLRLNIIRNIDVLMI
jgi:hypothetical protein